MASGGQLKIPVTRMWNLIGCARMSKALTEDEKNNYSPLYYIEKNLTKENSPDILIWHGDADLDVPYLQSERLNALLTRIVGTDKVEFKSFHNISMRQISCTVMKIWES